MTRSIWIRSCALAAGLAIASSLPTSAQERAVRAAPAGAPGQPGGAPGQPGGAPGQPGGAPGQPGEPAKPGEAPKAEPVKTTARPQKSETPPNPEELKVQPDADGMVRFNFQGQPWLGVLEWLARISQKSLDWQEVPSDFLNLRTQRSYSVEEARDLINRHLLDRGFTLLNHGEVLTVANVKKLDPSLVPRVRIADLDSRQPHDFVKASFALDWLIAEKAVEELKPYISPNGTLTALKSTNRVEVKDTVANLREIRDLLAEEQSNQGRKRLVEEFKLEHVRAADVVEQLQDILGLEKKPANAGPMTPEQQQQMQMQQQMMRQQQQQGGQPAPTKPKAEVHLVINQRENSVIAHAPADQMAVISETVKLLDVPADRSRSLLRNNGRVQGYRMASIDPEVFVKMLQETGELDPTTRVQFDKKNRSVIVNGSLADHMLIRNLVTKLDGSDRRFDVIKLRRLEADYVAGTIEFMMGAGEKKQQNNNRGWYDPWGYGSRNQQPEDESKKFRVDADVDNNRLLNFANYVERVEIENLLVKLGEIPASGGNPSTMRVLDSIDPADAEELLRKLKKAWPGISPNQLQFGPGTKTRDDDETDAPRKPAPRKPAVQEKTTDRAPAHPLTRQPLQLADLRVASPLDSADTLAVAPPVISNDSETSESSSIPEPSAAAESSEKAPAEAAAEAASSDEVEQEPMPPFGRGRPAKPQAAPPIRIGRGPDGKLMIASEDPAALDQLEELVAQMAPPRRDYKVFRMKYKSTYPYFVAQNLKAFFEDDDKKKNNRSFNPWWYGGYGNQTEETTRRLSKRRPLKFVDDLDSNSIIVIGADAAQLKIIAELIDLYDVPESKDPASARLTKVYQVKYSKSRIIADAVKEVYRDLLSTNDPAMQNQNNKKDSGAPERSYTFIYGSGSGDDKKPETPVKFKGALSLGIDELSNTLIISAGEGLLTSVMRTVEELDLSARATIPRLQVIQLDRNIDVGEVQKRLTKLTVKPQPKQPPQQQQPQQQKQGPVPGSETTTEIFN